MSGKRYPNPTGRPGNIREHNWNVKMMQNEHMQWDALRLLAEYNSRQAYEILTLTQNGVSDSIENTVSGLNGPLNDHSE